MCEGGFRRYLRWLMIGVIVNPHAGRNRWRNTRYEQLREIVGGDGVVERPATLAELETAVRELHRRGVDLLAVCGGDGSFFRTLSCVVPVYGDEALPSFLPLRGGSMNTIARSIGCRPGGPEAILNDIVGRRRRGETPATTQRQLLRVNRRHFGFMTGAGAVVRFLQAYYAEGNGPITAARVFGRAMASALVGSSFAKELLRPLAARLAFDGVPITQDRFNFLYASSITEIGLGIRVTYRGDERPGHFHLIAADIRPMQALVRVPRLRRGQGLDLPSVYDEIGRSLRIEFPVPTHYMVDGDVLDASHELTVESGPRLTILR